MSLKDVLFVDAQTTGMRPPAAQLLELAWGHGDDGEIVSHLVGLPEGETIPRRVSEITGLFEPHMAAARTRDEVRTELGVALAGRSALVIHYATFEKPFLLDLLAQGEIPLPVLCTHQLVKRLFPNLPSQNIRATAGFFGPAVIGHNRAGPFVRATRQIWRGLLPELERLGLSSVRDVQAWLEVAPNKKASRFEYRLDKMKRLELPDSPGIYRMLGKNGEILYVGKATSLRSRVNSYFRGQKGRDRRKLEMLAQVWDLHVTPCATPLEAALLESDEIKRVNPPYNVVLKTGRRHLVFYARDFSAAAVEQSALHPVGPYRNGNWIEHLRLLERSLASDAFAPELFFEPLPEEDLRLGYKLFSERHGVESLRSVRELLAYGLVLHRAFEEPEDDEQDGSDEGAGDDTVVTVEDIAGKFERLLRRAGGEYWRTRRLTRLLNARVRIGQRVLHFRHGHLNFDESELSSAPKALTPWAGLQIDTYDRMSIVLSELDRSDQRAELL